MKLMFATAMRVAAVMALSVVAFAQAAGQAPAEPQAGGAASAQTKAGAAAPAQQTTLVGCVQREADYRRAQDAGKGGAAGTGVGAGNEFVLINASMSTAAGSPAATSGNAAGTPTGTGGSAGSAYELTGPNEGRAEQYVGKRVEIMGTLKPAETSASGPTGGPTAGAPPKGVDVTSQDLKLREMEVSSVKEVPGACPAATK